MGGATERDAILSGKLTDKALEFARYRSVRRIVTSIAVVCSALLQAFVLQVFIRPSGLLSSGFTGLAILIDRIASLGGLSFPTFAGMIALNIPVALVCWRHISHRFVIFSSIQVVLASMFLQLLHFQPLMNETILNVVFGGVLYGLSIAVALKGGASTGGTDFISMLVAKRTGKTIWSYVFAGNCLMLVVFGWLFGWENAAWSIIFQYLSTHTISAFYHRYERVTLQITTQLPMQILTAYQSRYRHGACVVNGYGGYSHKKMSMITTVISAYEQDEIIHLIRTVDSRAVINVMRTETFVGGFYRGSIDEPVPTALPRDDGEVTIEG